MKKIISAILALAMCISLIGSAAALDLTTTPGSVVYTFSKTGLKDANGLTKAPASSLIADWWNPAKSFGGIEGNRFYPWSVVGFANHGWRFLDVSENMFDPGTSSWRLMNFHDNYLPILSSCTDDNAYIKSGTAMMTLELEKPTDAGFYSVKIKTNMRTYNADLNNEANFYINPMSDGLTAESSASEAALLGKQTYANTNDVEQLFDNVIYVGSEGNLALTFNPTIPAAYDSETQKVTQIRGINAKSATLTPITGTPELVIEDARLKIGNSTTASVKIGNQQLVNSFVTYSVPENSCIEIDDLGRITAISSGTATVTATVGDNNYTADVTVRGSEDVYSYYFTRSDANDLDVPNENIAGVHKKDNNLGAFRVYGFGGHEWRSLALDYADEDPFSAYMFWFDENQTDIRATYTRSNALQFDLSGITAAMLIDAPAKGIYAVAALLDGTASDIYLSEYKNDISYEDVYGIDNPGLWNVSVNSISKVPLSAYTADDQLAAEDFTATSRTNLGKYIYSDGETPLVLSVCVPEDGQVQLKELRFSPKAKELSLHIADNMLLVGETTTVSVKDTGTWTVVNDFVTYSVPEDSCVEIDDCGNITAKSLGATTVTATVGEDTYTATVTVYEEDKALADAFNATSVPTGYEAPTVTGVTIENTVINSVPGEYAGSVTLTADEEKNGNKFLYWAKGNTLGKKIISFSNKLENYMPEEGGKNYLIAIYEGDVSGVAEYYNANGQRVATETQPQEYPSMAGYGSAVDWEKYGDANIYVAKYESAKPAKNIEIDVEGGSGSGVYAYGDTVICTADEETDETPFKFWKKSGINGENEIVSADKVYKFSAWESCTVTAVYEKHYYTGEKMKIIIDTFTAGNETAVMAEFIGFGNNVVEKGIMWNGTKIAMTKPGNQFTVTGEAGDVFTGYAIVDTEEGYKLITDGSAEIK